MDYDEKTHLLCERFLSMHISWATMRTVSYTVIVFKLMNPQQKPAA